MISSSQWIVFLVGVFFSYLSKNDADSWSAWVLVVAQKYELRACFKDAIATLRLGRPRPDSKRIVKHVQRSAATNLDQDYIDQILQEMVRSNLIYNRPTEIRPSYYVTDKNSDWNVNANNTGNPKSMSDIDSDEPNDSDKPDVFHTLVTPNSKRDERPKNLEETPLQNRCFMSLKAQFI